MKLPIIFKKHQNVLIQDLINDYFSKKCFRLVSMNKI